VRFGKCVDYIRTREEVIKFWDFRLGLGLGRMSSPSVDLCEVNVKLGNHLRRCVPVCGSVTPTPVQLKTKNDTIQNRDVGFHVCHRAAEVCTLLSVV